MEHMNGEHLGKLEMLDQREILIGRLADCKIVTEPRFTSVSQHHALLRKTGEGWVLIDVGTQGKGSTFGTFINEIRLLPNKEVILNSGDEIRLGTKLGKYLKFHGEGTVPISQPISLSGRLTLDFEKRHILLDGRVISISLTPQEFDFILILWRKAGSICAFREICAGLWPDEKILASGSIDSDLKIRINTLSHGLRRKLKFALDDIDILENCRGVGYRLKV